MFLIDACVILIPTDARAPVLKQQPEAYVEVVKGEPLVLSIKAEGESPMSYRWFKGAQKLKYCSESVLRINSASTLDTGSTTSTCTTLYMLDVCTPRFHLWGLLSPMYYVVFHRLAWRV